MYIYIYVFKRYYIVRTPLLRSTTNEFRGRIKGLDVFYCFDDLRANIITLCVRYIYIRVLTLGRVYARRWL